MPFACNQKNQVMNNKIRKLLLILACGLIVAFGVSIYYQPKIFSIPTAINLDGDSIDIKIKNFNVLHEVLGNKQWELRADNAQIDNDKGRITLTRVAVTLNHNANSKSQIFADTGVMNTVTKEIELAGHVKFIADADQLFHRSRSPKSPSQINPEPIGE